MYVLHVRKVKGQARTGLQFLSGLGCWLLNPLATVGKDQHNALLGQVGASQSNCISEICIKLIPIWKGFRKTHSFRYNILY